MIKINVCEFVEHPVHTAFLVTDLAVLLFHRPPLFYSVAMFALLLWLTVFFVSRFERSKTFAVVWEPRVPQPAPAMARPSPAAVAAAAPEPAAAMAERPSAEPARTPRRRAPGAATPRSRRPTGRK